MWLGVALSQASTLCCVLGLVLQKLSARKLTGKTQAYLQPFWVLGFLLYITGQLLMPCALAYAPQSLLSCLAPSGLLANAVLTPLVLGERLRSAHLGSMVACFVGCFLNVRYGLTEEDLRSGGVHLDGRTLDLARVVYLVTRPAFFLLVCATFAIAAPVGLEVRRYFVAKRKVSPQKERAVSVRYCTPEDSGVSIPSAFSLCLLSSVFGAVSVSCTKMASTIIATQYEPGLFVLRGVGEVQPFVGLLLWILFSKEGRVAVVFLLAVPACAAISIGALNTSMLLHPSLLTMTLSCALGMVCQFVYGCVLFEEYRAFTAGTAAGTVVGICLNMGGMTLLLLGDNGEAATSAAGVRLEITGIRGGSPGRPGAAAKDA